jgi:orotidine-5'-phosphate decarboxylase
MESSKNTPFPEWHNAQQFSPRQLIVALDVETPEEALALVQQLHPLGVTFKVGMQLFYQSGPDLLKTLYDKGCSVFLDLKLHDIPNTVAGAAQSLVRHGATFFNVHAQGGSAMMQAAAQAGRKTAEEQGMPPPIIIAVTLLTSLSQGALSEELHVTDEAHIYAQHLALLAQSSGLNGVVCSAQEARIIRQACGPEFILVTPGIRPSGSATDDQSRILTPAQALAEGANFLVVGRPITRAKNPVQAAEGVLAEMEAASPVAT